MLDAQCSSKTQHVSLLEVMDVVEQDSTRSTCCACLSYFHIIHTGSTGLVLVLCRLLNWLFTDGELMLNRNRDRCAYKYVFVSVQHPVTNQIKPVVNSCQPVVDCTKTDPPGGKTSTPVLHNRLHKFPPFFNRSISDKTADIMSGEAFIEVNCFSSVSKTINFSWIGSILFKLGYIRWEPGPRGKTLLYINWIFKAHGGHHCKPQDYVTHDTLVSLLYNHFSIVIWFFVDFGSKTMLSNVVKITIIGLICF